jgi:hypothetical protein
VSGVYFEIYHVKLKAPNKLFINQSKKQSKFGSLIVYFFSEVISGTHDDKQRFDI